MIRPALIACVLALVPGAALAQSVQLIGEYRDWTAYSAAGGGTATICFALSQPTDVSPVPDGYTGGYLYLTHRPAENVSNELNFVAGYNFAPDQAATLMVGGQSYDLFTQRDAAWLLDPTQNDNLAGSLRAGSSVTIEATTDKGILVSETFSLSGATAASRAIDGC